jgi:hypothetical protein
MIGFFVGVFVTYFGSWLIGRYMLNKAAAKSYEAYIKHVKDGHLVVTDWQSIEDVFYVLLKLIKDKRQHDSFAEFLDRPQCDPKDVGHE